MPSFNILKKSEFDNKSFRVQSIIGTYDLSVKNITENFKGEIPLERLENWNIGIIFGNSGTGKSTIAKELFGENYITNFDYTAKSIVDDMPKDISIKDIARAFSACGLGSVPSWLKPYSVLSNGEKMRVDLARAILEDRELICFDEFTSVVNREVAKTSSYAISKAIRKLNKKFVAVSCHDDIIDWLEPDWIFDANKMEFSLVKKKDLPSTCPSFAARQNFGIFLGGITI